MLIDITPPTQLIFIASTMYYYKTMPSLVGQLKLVASDQGLAAILWEKDNPKRVKFEPIKEHNTHPLLLETQKQLQEYFEGTRTVFSLLLDFAGTEFQKKVWQALLTIPFGETRSYGQIAAQVGNNKASRPVGAANGRNPISIVVPCHRVIGTSGQLTGFAGGLEIKAFLLNHEQKNSVLY